MIMVERLGQGEIGGLVSAQTAQTILMGYLALWAHGELAAGACAPMLGWDRGGSSFAGARAWWGACGTGARGPLRGVFGRLPLARLRESAFWGA